MDGNFKIRIFEYSNNFEYSDSNTILVLEYKYSTTALSFCYDL